MAVELASANPCAANRLISVNTRRCASIANASSSSTAASRLMSCAQSGAAVICSLAPQQQVDQHRQYREKERRAQKLRRAEDAHLRRQGFDQRKSEAADGGLGEEHRGGAENRQPVGAALHDSERQEQRQSDARIVEKLHGRAP